MLNVSIRQPIIATMVVVLVATATAAALVWVGVGSGTYSRHAEYLTWGTLTVGLVGVSVAGGIYCLPAWRDLRARSPLPARLLSYVLSAFIVLCYDACLELVGRVYLGQKPPELPLGAYREIGLISLIGLPTLPALSGLVLAALLLSRKKLPWDRAGGGIAITELLRIRGHLQRFLTVLALVIGGNVLTLGALGTALNAATLPPIPPTILLVYGAAMTSLLAMVYVPAYLAWQARAGELRDELHPLPTDGRPNHDWYIGRADLEGLLNLKVNAGAAFVTGLAGVSGLCSWPACLVLWCLRFV
jgi:hypothetical protein